MLNILGYSSPSQTGQASGITSNVANNMSIGATTSGQLSPFAQMLSQLQQLEGSSPSQYAKETQQISTNLAAASSTAQTRGETTLAAKLSTLSQDFSTASRTGQLPNVGDLEKAMQSAAQANTAGTSTTAPTHHSKVASIIGHLMSLAASI
jgi:hypothetical protein